MGRRRSDGKPKPEADDASPCRLKATVPASCFLWSGDGWTEVEQDSLQSVLIAQNGPADLPSIESKIQPTRGLLQGIVGSVLSAVALDGGRKRIMNMALGYRARTEPQASEAPIGDLFHGPDIRNAAYKAKAWIESHPNRLPAANDYKTDWNAYFALHRRQVPLLGAPDENEYRDIFTAVAMAYGTLRRLPVGSAGALTRASIGIREFDYNFDGLAHFGMLPDFLQDLSNNGLGAKEMAPLFRSAEDYIRVWEKCEQLRTQ